MADDWDYDDGVYEEEGWFYVEDEFDLADELAEGQVPDPGYSGTNNEIENMDGFDFDVFAYFDDLEYGDDPYFDYGLPNSKSNPSETGQKRKRGTANVTPGKRRKLNEQALVGESEPLIFRSRDERYRAYKQDAPLLKGKSYAFLPDWRERFADEDGIMTITKMPADMRKAAEAQNDETPPKTRQLGEDAYMDDGGEDDGEGEDGWEDEEEDEEGGIGIDPEMLKSILREKLGAAGLDGMDEAAFMQTLQKMMSGDTEGDEAAGDLANSLLGKLTSNTGDEALSGWLSQQGVSLEDDDASSVATADVPETARRATSQKDTVQPSPQDSAVEMSKSKGGATEMAFHPGSPTASTKKRSAPEVDDNPTKKHKKVQFDVPPSSDSHNASTEEAGPPTSDDPLMSEATVSAKAVNNTRAANAAAADANKEVSEEAVHEDGGSKRGSRKRKASAADEKPAGKKTKMRELQDLGPLPEAPSPAPPAKRTRSARSKAGK